MTIMPAQSVWTNHAHQWSRIAGPLRPSPSDVALLRAHVDSKSPLMLLGTTVELRALSPVLIAVDNNPTMIERFENDNPPADHTAKLADWRDVASIFPENHLASAVGDGSLNMLPFTNGYIDTLGALSQILKPNAPLAIRLFATPEPDAGETLETVFTIARSGQIGTFHAFKWRLAHALCAANADANIAVQTIHAAFNANVPDRDAFAQKTGWTRESINTIDAYQSAASVYSFPTLSALKSMLPKPWKLCDVKYGDYELADRCPIIYLQNEK